MIRMQHLRVNGNRTSAGFAVSVDASRKHIADSTRADPQ